jgi:hypothetical protein
MARKSAPTYYRTTRYRKLIRAPTSFVYRWCTDYREDDDRITNDLYHFRSKVVLREPDRVIRIITVPGRDRNRCTDVEIITLKPPLRWSLEKFSLTDDETGEYRLTRKGPALTCLEMRFKTKWKGTIPPSRTAYRALFHQVWDRYVETIEREFVQSAR